MTAQQLERLAELSALARDFYRRSNPAAARRFHDAAHIASILAADLTRDEEDARLAREVAELHSELRGPSVA